MSYLKTWSLFILDKYWEATGGDINATVGWNEEIANLLFAVAEDLADISTDMDLTTALVYIEVRKIISRLDAVNDVIATMMRDLLAPSQMSTAKGIRQFVSYARVDIENALCATTIKELRNLIYRISVNLKKYTKEIR